MNLCAPQRIHEFNHNGNDSKYLTEYNALANVPSRSPDTRLHKACAKTRYGAKCFRNRSISVKNALVLDRLAPGRSDGLEGVRTLARLARLMPRSTDRTVQPQGRELLLTLRDAQRAVSVDDVAAQPVSRWGR